MRTSSVLVTGAGGEIGHGLITRLAGTGRPIVTIDIAPLEPSLARLVRREFTGSITDSRLLERVLAEFEVDLVFHLAALLSTRSEFTPVTAHDVNVEGTLTLLEFAQHEGESHGRTVTIRLSLLDCGLWPPRPRDEDAGRARARGRVEHSDHHVRVQQALLRAPRPLLHAALQATGGRGPVAAGRLSGVRFPGLISALTVPSGGTSDFAPEMIHAAARSEPYACFVRRDTRIPFMAMPDAIEGLLQLAAVARNCLTQTAYNVTAFNPTAEEICDVVSDAFPRASITWEVDEKRQRIVDSWPADVDDSAPVATGASRRDTISSGRSTST